MDFRDCSPSLVVIEELKSSSWTGQSLDLGVFPAVDSLGQMQWMPKRHSRASDFYWTHHFSPSLLVFFARSYFAWTHLSPNLITCSIWCHGGQVVHYQETAIEEYRPSGARLLNPKSRRYWDPEPLHRNFIPSHFFQVGLICRVSTLVYAPEKSKHYPCSIRTEHQQVCPYPPPGVASNRNLASPHNYHKIGWEYVLCESLHIPNAKFFFHRL